jgi:predicted RNA-binding Zn-ribbon protein involved in translation (DUF1610 family)
MALIWGQILPTWARVACGLFGVLTVASSLTGRGDFAVPGVIVGGVWLLVAVKGLPRFPTASTADPLGSIAIGLRTIRRRRLSMYLAMGAWMVLGLLAFPRVPKEQLQTAFFVSCLVPVVFFVRAMLSACPRCGQWFFPIGRFAPRLSALNRCQNCGLGIQDDRNDQAA